MGVKNIESDAPYPNICGADMFPSFEVDWIIHCFGIARLHHE